jgi:hypothetical protein
MSHPTNPARGWRQLSIDKELVRSHDSQRVELVLGGMAKQAPLGGPRPTMIEQYFDATALF